LDVTILPGLLSRSFSALSISRITLLFAVPHRFRRGEMVMEGLCVGGIT